MDYGDGQTQGYSFDAMGNRLSRTDSSAGTTAYAFNAANMLTSAGGNAYTSDANGNTLTGGGRTNTWDSENRLTSSTVGGVTSTYTYGADGLRRSSTVGGITTNYVYDGQSMVEEMRGGSVYATYLTGPRGPEYRRDASGAVSWYVYDGLGSVVAEVAPDGTVTASEKYDVYGALRGGSGAGSTTRHHFVGGLGHIADQETGLIYMRARYYDPAVGRFVSEDPDLQGKNWFVYCSNDPINLVDRTGKLVGLLAALEGQALEDFYNAGVIAAGAGLLTVVAIIIGAYIANQECAADGLLLADKQDIRLIDWVCDKYKLNRDQRRQLHGDINERLGEKFTRAQIEAEAKSIKDASGGGESDDSDE